MCETHKEYVARISKLIEKSGEDRTLDGLPVKNCVLTAQRVLILESLGLLNKKEKYAS